MNIKYFMLTLLSVCALVAQAQERIPEIIPQPAEVCRLEGDTPFTLQREALVWAEQSEQRFAAEYLARYTEQYLGIPLKVSSPQRTARGKKRLQQPEATPAVVLVDLANDACSGGYRLTVTPEQIRIEGNDAAGVFYGVQTLIQMLPVRPGIHPRIVPLSVVDYPRFAYRGLHLDVVRHYFPVSFIKRYIDYMALHKLNYFHWHLTDDQGWRLQLHSHPELTERGSDRDGEIEGLYPGKYRSLPYGGYYTQEEVKEVLSYAAERFVTVIPEVDIPGHCMAVLAANPHFSTTPDEPKQCALTWGIYNKFNNVLAPTSEVFRFLDEVYGELCRLFPGPYIHVGGDECAKRWWKESEVTQQFMREQGLKSEKELQSHFIHYVKEVVNRHGKTLIGWDEVLEGGISTDCVVMNWRDPKHGRKAARTGHRLVSTSINWSYFNIRESSRQRQLAPRGPLPLQKVYDYAIVPDSLTSEEQSLVWGAQACLWTEYVTTEWKAEFALFPRLAAFAENVWSQPGCKEWEHFVRKMPLQFERYDLWRIRYNDAFFRQQDIVRVQ